MKANSGSQARKPAAGHSPRGRSARGRSTAGPRRAASGLPACGLGGLRATCAGLRARMRPLRLSCRFGPICPLAAFDFSLAWAVLRILDLYGKFTKMFFLCAYSVLAILPKLLVIALANIGQPDIGKSCLRPYLDKPSC